ncbi:MULTISPECIES: NTP transferase domain-containing protein [unclassified Sutcliffiella]|uniref:NTP transferase domain-containing protein n=1 Tax=unclassified Sutcliffiella TaxID=2837532 RepID=UPI0030CE8042
MIFGIYLAAGQSKRMGCPKLSLPLGDRPLGSIALETAISSSLDSIVVVTNEHDSLSWLPSYFFLEHFKKNWIHTRCKESAQGQAESLKCGLKTAQKMQAEAVMIILADQPFVTREIIDHIISLYKKEKPNYVASSSNGVLCPPVLFNSTLFPALYQLNGDEGARSILKNNSKGLTVEFNEGKSFQDIDTPTQYRYFQ